MATITEADSKRIAEGAHTLYELKYNFCKTVLNLTDDEAKRDASLDVVNYDKRERAKLLVKEAAFYGLLREELPKLVQKLRAAGLENGLGIDLSPKNAPFTIGRGKDKGKVREWRFSTVNPERKKKSRADKTSAALKILGTWNTK